MIFDADTWNKWVKSLRRWRLRPSSRVRATETADGIILLAERPRPWRHPWSTSTAWNTDDSGWEAEVKAGFVNGREVYVGDASLLDTPAPKLKLTWRNPLMPLGVADDGSFTGGEGYPKFFESLGVKPASRPKGSTSIDTATAERTREIRASDVYLAAAKIQSRQTVSVLSPGTDFQSLALGVAVDDSYLKSVKHRHRLKATSKWTEPAVRSPLDLFEGTSVENLNDEILICTVWAVSPEGAKPEDKPDESWSMYPQHHQFWNLNYASRAVVPTKVFEPITLRTGLAGGLADQIFASLLQMPNDLGAQAEAFLFSTDFSGVYWST